MRNAIVHLGRLPVCVSLALLSIPIAAADNLPKFQLRRLGTLGEEASVGTAINSVGQVTGFVGATPTRFLLLPPDQVPPDQILPGFYWLGQAFLFSDGQMTRLGTLGGLYSMGTDINGVGQVTGIASIAFDNGEYAGGIPHAFHYDNGRMTDLGGLGRATIGTDINAKGQVVGSRMSLEGFGQAFLVSNAQPITLDDLLVSGELMAVAGMNDAGQFAGHRDSSGICCGPQAFVHKDGQTIEIGNLGGLSSQAAAINALGQVTGSATTTGTKDNFPYGVPHAFLYSGGVLNDLGTLGGLTSSGFAINRSGKVTGVAETKAGDEHAFLWDGTAMRDLGTLGGTTSRGYVINTRGWVTGYATTAGNSANHAFLSDGGLMVDLNKLIDSGDPLKSHVTLYTGVDINHSGQILANGRDNRTNKHHAFIATPMEYQVLFIAPATSTRPKVGSTVPVKMALIDVNGKRISDARALTLPSAPCKVKFSVGGAQTHAAKCMKYDAARNEFFFNWKLATTGTGPATIKITATYQFSVPAAVTATGSRLVTIIR